MLQELLSIPSSKSVLILALVDTWCARRDSHREDVKAQEKQEINQITKRGCYLTPLQETDISEDI